MNNYTKRTKVVCTIGPASNNEETLTKMIEAGMNVARNNFSHGDHESHKNNFDLIRSAASKLNKTVAVLLDTKGPEIRTHLFKDGSCVIEKDSKVIVSINEVEGTPSKFSINYPGLINDVKAGGQILVDDGYLTLDIEKVDTAKGEIHCVAKNSHQVKDRRGINVPNTVLNMPFISDKDKSDIEFGADQDVDFIAASFVRRASDVKEIREILKAKKNTTIQIISKIENLEGIENIDEIIEESDGIMVARGDLGVEVPYSEVPFMQKMMIEKCQRAGKIVITATQMLESMQNNPRPTRAEVNDVSNSILDGSDAIMLSGESAGGKYPVESVQTMTNIATRTEQDLDYKSLTARVVNDTKGDETTNAIAISSDRITQDLELDAIVCPSFSGKTARAISRLRPNTNIIAVVPTEKVARSLAINFAITPIVSKDICATLEELETTVVNLAVEKLGLKKGSRVLVTAGMPIGQVGSTNMIKIVDIKK